VLAATSDGNTLPHRGNHSKRSSQNWDNINIWCTRVVRSVYHLYLGVREGGTTVGPGNRCRHANNCPALYLMTSTVYDMTVGWRRQYHTIVGRDVFEMCGVPDGSNFNCQRRAAMPILHQYCFRGYNRHRHKI